MLKFGGSLQSFMWSVGFKACDTPSATGAVIRQTRSKKNKPGSACSLIRTINTPAPTLSLIESQVSIKLTSTPHNRHDDPRTFDRRALMPLHTPRAT